MGLVNSMWAKLQGFVRRRSAGEILARADAARDGGQWPEAARLYGDYLALWPEKAAIHVQHGHALKEAGQGDLALAAYRMAVGLMPNDVDALCHLAQAEAAAGSGAEAAALLALAQERAAQRGDRDAEARLLAGEADVARDGGQWSAGAFLYGRAIALCPMAAWMVQRGHCLKEAGRFADAEVLYRDALAHGAAEADVMQHLAFVAARGGSNALPPPMAADGGRLASSEDVAELLALFLPGEARGGQDLLDWMRRAPTLDLLLAALVRHPAFRARRAAMLRALAAEEVL